MISAPKLTFLWNAAMGGFGIVFWIYGVLTLFLPETFAPFGFILAVLGAFLVIFFVVTGAVAGKKILNVPGMKAQSTTRTGRTNSALLWPVLCIWCSGCCLLAGGFLSKPHSRQWVHLPEVPIVSLWGLPG